MTWDHTVTGDTHNHTLNITSAMRMWWTREGADLTWLLQWWWWWLHTLACHCLFTLFLRLRTPPAWTMGHRMHRTAPHRTGTVKPVETRWFITVPSRTGCVGLPTSVHWPTTDTISTTSSGPIVSHLFSIPTVAMATNFFNKQISQRQDFLLSVVTWSEYVNYKDTISTCQASPTS